MVHKSLQESHGVGSYGNKGGVGSGDWFALMPRAHVGIIYSNPFWLIDSSLALKPYSWEIKRKLEETNPKEETVPISCAEK